MKWFGDGEKGREFLQRGLAAKDRLIPLMLVGLLLLVLAIPSGGREKQKGSTGETTEKGETEAVSEAQNYVDQLERQLEDVLSQCQGVGRVNVMITLESGAENVVKEDVRTQGSTVMQEDVQGKRQSSSETDSERVTVYSGDGNGAPYVIKEKMPSIAGVLVVAEGGGDSQVAQDVSDAVRALFPVEAHKIKVMKMEKK